MSIWHILHCSYFLFLLFFWWALPLQLRGKSYEYRYLYLFVHCCVSSAYDSFILFNVANTFVVVVQGLSHVWLLMNLWTVAHQTPLSITISQSLLRLMSIESVMLSERVILCHPLFLCLQSFPASESFLVSWLFASGGQSNGASASASSFHWIFRVDFL